MSKFFQLYRLHTDLQGCSSGKVLGSIAGKLLYVRVCPPSIMQSSKYIYIQASYSFKYIEDDYNSDGLDIQELETNYLDLEISAQAQVNQNSYGLVNLTYNRNLLYMIECIISYFSNTPNHFNVTKINIKDLKQVLNLSSSFLSVCFLNENWGNSIACLLCGREFTCQQNSQFKLSQYINLIKL